jgi:hypothetical protein
MNILRRSGTIVCLGLLFLSLSSCTQILNKPFLTTQNSQERFFGKTRLIDPFSDTDHVLLTQAAAMETAAGTRLRPATAATGSRAVTLEDCRSLAVANSLEAQQAYIEQLAQQALEKSNRTKLIPHVLFSGELGSRDNEAFSYSEVLGQEGVTPQPGSTGSGVNQFSTGRERTTWRYSFESRGSPTDAALAYYLVKTSRNDKRKHHYVRVRIIQRLYGIVDSSFARLLCLQEIIPMAEKLLSLRRKVSGKMEELFAQNLVQAEDYHKNKQKLIKG